MDHEQDIRRRQQHDDDEGSEEEVFGLDDGEDDDEEEDEDDMSDLGDVGGEQEDSEEDIDSKFGSPSLAWATLLIYAAKGPILTREFICNK